MKAGRRKYNQKEQIRTLKILQLNLFLFFMEGNTD